MAARVKWEEKRKMKMVWGLIHMDRKKWEWWGSTPNSTDDGAVDINESGCGP